MIDHTHTNPYVGVDADLDAWTREVVETHFDPETGTPYWLEYEREQGIDVRSAVDGFADLRAVFDPFDADDLRSVDAADFAPQRMDGERRVYETSGSTGAPKRVVMADYWQEQARWVAGLLDDAGFPAGNVLMLGPPGGANNAGVFAQHLAHEWDALPYHVNMDPRWAKRLSQSDTGRFEAYVDHLIDQAETVLASQAVTVLFSTSRLLERPRVRDLVADSDVEAVYHGGTALDPDTHRVFRENWYDDVALAGEYGNTLMGVAQEPLHLRPPAERSYRLDYAPCYPYFVPELLDESGDPVDYGKRGRVRLTVLTKDFFVPLLDERDEATRVEGVDPLPWDWLRDPATGEAAAEDAVEGVY
jgi:thienamycin biosynthesis protein ThnN